MKEEEPLKEITAAFFRNLYTSVGPRNLQPDPLCPICQKEAETIEHTLLLCPWTAQIWQDNSLVVYMASPKPLHLRGESPAPEANSTQIRGSPSELRDLVENRGDRENKAAIACLCRDSQGRLIDGFSKTVEATSAEQAEAISLLETLAFLSSRTNRRWEVQIGRAHV